MKLETAQVLVNLIEDMGEEAQLYEDYSGRGMYGKTTTGIVVNNPMLIARAIANYAAHNSEYMDSDIVEALEDFADSRTSTDSMAYDTIIY